MVGIQNYGSFVSAILVFQMVPGAGTVAILTATARGGVRAGLAAVLGTLTGDFLYMMAAAAGLAAVMAANRELFLALQWFGAGYLCWMGLGLLSGRATELDAEMPGSGSKHFRQALAVSVTNPKVALFFVAFFPLFLSPRSSHATLAAMMAHVTVLSFAYQVVLVAAGNAVAGRIRSLPLARRLATGAAGAALVAFGVKLAAANR